MDYEFKISQVANGWIIYKKTPQYNGMGSLMGSLNPPSYTYEAVSLHLNLKDMLLNLSLLLDKLEGKEEV